MTDLLDRYQSFADQNRHSIESASRLAILGRRSGGRSFEKARLIQALDATNPIPISSFVEGLRSDCGVLLSQGQSLPAPRLDDHYFWGKLIQDHRVQGPGFDYQLDQEGVIRERRSTNAHSEQVFILASFAQTVAVLNGFEPGLNAAFKMAVDDPRGYEPFPSSRFKEAIGALPNETLKSVALGLQEVHWALDKWMELSIPAEELFGDRASQVLQLREGTRSNTAHILKNTPSDLPCALDLIMDRLGIDPLFPEEEWERIDQGLPPQRYDPKTFE